MIITIDGPSGSGKTTIAKSVAAKLNIPYFDTGAMYRCVALGLLQEGISPSETQKIDPFLKTFPFSIQMHGQDKRYFIGKLDVTDQIRTQKVNKIVSEVAALPNVRKAMWKLQREYGAKQSTVFEGRDMGTTVFPEADLKVFLDANPNIRAQRRFNEMREKLPKEAERLDEGQMQAELERRDHFDRSRKLSPLRCPKKALRIDTSHLEIEEIVTNITEAFHKKVKKLLPSWLRSRNMHIFYRFILFLAWGFIKLLYRHKVYGLEHYMKRAAIIAANHNSYFDPPMTAISWPEEVHFLAKEELFKPFLFGRFIRAMNSHPVKGEVADVSVFKTILQLLKEGKQVVLFPEGGRMNGEIGKIKLGVGMLLLRSKEAVIPTYIHGAYEIWDRHHKLPKLFGKKSACVFGTPILWESFAHLEKRKAQEEIAQALSEALHTLKKWYLSGAKGTPP